MNLMKRLTAGALSLCLALAMAACGSPVKEGDTNDGGSSGAKGTNVPMGRYVEKSLTLPVGDNNDNNFLTHVNKDGSLDIYGYADAERKTAVRWHSTDGENWVEAVDEWMTTLSPGSYFRHAADAPDGSRYLLVEADNTSLHLYHIKDGAASEITVPSWLEDNTDNGDMQISMGGSVTISGSKSGEGADTDAPEEGGDGEVTEAEEGNYGARSLNPRGMEVLENGDLLIGFMMGGAVRYTPEGEVVRKYPISYMLYMAVAPGKLYCSGFEGDKIQCFDLETGAEEEALLLENTVAANPAYLFADDKGNLYSTNSGGIHRIAPGGSIWETVLDGKLSTMNAPSTNLQTVLSDGAGGFYLNFYSQGGGYKLSHAVYDENMPSVPSRELSVYSLRENSTVRQAIATYQANNPDVMVNYQVGMGDDTSATVEDVVRSLNQEILAGKGPDVLILDGLPVNSYIEKGVLADLSDLVASLDGEYYQPVLDTFKQDGSLPAVPARFSLPMMFGRDGVTDTVNSLSDLVKEGEGLMTLNPDLTKYLESLSKGSSPAWVTEDGQLDSEKLALFLTDAKAIYDKFGNAGQTDSSGFVSISSSNAGGDFFELGMDYMDFSMGKTKAFFSDVTGLSYFSMAVEFRDLPGDRAQFKLMPGQSENCFIPSAIAGVNAAGKRQEEAMGFVKTLLSTEVQFLSFSDGFGVSITALDKQIAQMREKLKEGGFDDVDYGAIIKPIFANIKTPVLTDKTLLDAVLAEGVKVLQDAESVEEAVQAVQKKMELRLAE